MSESKCKIAIGSAYQRPVRTDWSQEEWEWQNRLLAPPPIPLKEKIKSVCMALLWVAFIGALLLWSPR